MKYFYLYDNKLRQVVQINPIAIEGPYKIIFCKDRKTKQRYVMLRQEGADPFDIPKRQLFETKYCQYDDIAVETK